ncbi:cuticle protein 19-like [Schistocerca nitens]|uniref:cuticle protein 19-like n=1 Tax=Schistocerca nitens TaxID=7011 RepID=UPI002117F66C|nr:cuticle protein 19-like [Schistocerca nitens]
MNLLKSVWVAVAVAAVAVAEPALPGQFQYLPPDRGYNYPTPKVPFTTPTTPGYRPPQTTPSYGTPPPPTRPTYPQPPVTYPVGPPVTTPPYGRPTPPPTYGPPPGDHHHDHVHVPGMPFDFEYAVKDDAHGADYAHRANSNGDVVQGEYRNLLPDGRVQVVRYTADWATGFHAEVSYQGEARYPAPAPPGTYGPPQQQQQPPQQTGY